MVWAIVLDSNKKPGIHGRLDARLNLKPLLSPPLYLDSDYARMNDEEAAVYASQLQAQQASNNGGEGGEVPINPARYSEPTRKDLEKTTPISKEIVSMTVPTF